MNMEILSVTIFLVAELNIFCEWKRPAIFLENFFIGY